MMEGATWGREVGGRGEKENMIGKFFLGFVAFWGGVSATKAKFRKLQHIKCIHNDKAPNLLVGKLYSVKSVHDYTDSHGPDAWGVYVWGDEAVYHHSFFEPSIGPIAGEDFAGPATQKIETGRPAA